MSSNVEYLNYCGRKIRIEGSSQFFFNEVSNAQTIDGAAQIHVAYFKRAPKNYICRFVNKWIRLHRILGISVDVKLLVSNGFSELEKDLVEEFRCFLRNNIDCGKLTNSPFIMTLIFYFAKDKANQQGMQLCMDQITATNPRFISLIK